VHISELSDGGFNSSDLEAAPMPCGQLGDMSLRECQARIFTGYKHGPVLKDAQTYLQQAGVGWIPEHVVEAQHTSSPDHSEL